MDPVTKIVHWPGKDVTCCDRHAAGLERVNKAMGGMPLAVTITTATNLTCSNCQNEKEKGHTHGKEGETALTA